MGLLSFLTRQAEPEPLMRLPSGSFTVGPDGRIMTSTLPSTFPKDLLNEIAWSVQTTLNEAIEAELPLAELVVHYPSFKIIARNMRGNALIFLVPINQASVTTQFKRL
jgi:hypothetical protein